MSQVIYPEFLEQDLSALINVEFLRSIRMLMKKEWVDNVRDESVSRAISDLMKPVFRFVYRALEINGWKKIKTDDPRAHVYVETVFMTGDKVDEVLKGVRELMKISARKPEAHSPLLQFLQSMQQAAKSVYERERYGKLLKPKEKTAEIQAQTSSVSTTFTFDS